LQRFDGLVLFAVWDENRDDAEPSLLERTGNRVEVERSYGWIGHHGNFSAQSESVKKLTDALQEARADMDRVGTFAKIDV